MIRRAGIVMFALALTLVCSSATAEPPALQQARKRLEEGDNHAGYGRYARALEEYVAAYEVVVPALRGLPRLQPVDAKLMTREELGAYILETMHEEIEPEDVRFVNAFLAAHDLAPEGFDIEEALVAMYEDSIAGFYDPAKDAMYLIVEDDEWYPFDTGEQRSTLAHEMVHAIADQHYDLDAMQERIEDDSDMLIALSSLIEGEASQFERAEAAWSVGIDPSKCLATDPNVLAIPVTLSRLLWRVALVPAAGLPSILVETETFPYTQGLLFAAHATSRGGWTAIDAVYADPPLSTEQILHPEKYFDERDVPMEVTLPDLQTRLDPQPAWRLVGTDVVGELQTSLIVRDGHAAAGWDGDRIALFENEEGRFASAWFSVWDTERDAIEFVEAYRARYDALTVLRRGARVAIARGFSEYLGAVIATELLESDIRPKTLPPRPLLDSEAGADKDEGEGGDRERR